MSSRHHVIIIVSSLSFLVTTHRHSPLRTRRTILSRSFSIVHQFKCKRSSNLVQKSSVLIQNHHFNTKVIIFNTESILCRSFSGCILCMKIAIIIKVFCVWNYDWKWRLFKIGNEDSSINNAQTRLFRGGSVVVAAISAYKVRPLLAWNPSVSPTKSIILSMEYIIVSMKYTSLPGYGWVWLSISHQKWCNFYSKWWIVY